MSNRENLGAIDARTICGIRRRPLWWGKIDPDVKAIVCTGYFDDPIMTDFDKYGFKGALPKPYEKKSLKETLEKLLVEVASCMKYRKIAPQFFGPARRVFS